AALGDRVPGDRHDVLPGQRLAALVVGAAAGEEGEGEGACGEEGEASLVAPGSAAVVRVRRRCG
ncbi:hypothetical protein, partial [Streptomyces sp. NPDC002172]